MRVDRRGFIVGCAALAAQQSAPLSFSAQQGAPSGDRRSPTHRCLFLDDAHIDRAEALELRPHPGKPYAGNPLLQGKYPWEKVRLQIYGHCIVYNTDRKLYQMYYLAQPSSSHWPNLRVGGARKVGWATLPAYAESTDGIHWERPLRRDVPYEDIAETNLLDLHEGQSFEAGVMWDPHGPDPRRRYQAFIWDQHFDLPKPGKLDFRRAKPSKEFPRGLIVSQLLKDESGKIVYEQLYNDRGIRVAFSADGIHWKKHPGWVIPCYSDTGQSVLYDSRLGKYVAFGRFNQQKESPAYYVGRNVTRVESADFIHWSEPELVLAGDSKDPESFQINSMPVDFYEGLYVGIMEVDVRPFPRPGRPLQLAVSRDGQRWTRVANRAPITLLDQTYQYSNDESPSDAWDVYGGRPATGFFVHDGEIRMYYCSGNKTGMGVGMVTWRRDGFVSLYAGPAGGELLTRAFIPTSPDLHLNMDASAGDATVRVCDFQGQPLKGWKINESSEPIRGNQLDTVVRWAGSDFGQRVGKATTLRIKMRNADLYSYWTG